MLQNYCREIYTSLGFLFSFGISHSFTLPPLFISCKKRSIIGATNSPINPNLPPVTTLVTLHFSLQECTAVRLF